MSTVLLNTGCHELQLVKKKKKKVPAIAGKHKKVKNNTIRQYKINALIIEEKLDTEKHKNQNEVIQTIWN